MQSRLRGESLEQNGHVEEYPIDRSMVNKGPDSDIITVSAGIQLGSQPEPVSTP